MTVKAEEVDRHDEIWNIVLEVEWVDIPMFIESKIKSQWAWRYINKNYLT